MYHCWKSPSPIMFFNWYMAATIVSRILQWLSGKNLPRYQKICRFPFLSRGLASINYNGATSDSNPTTQVIYFSWVYETTKGRIWKLGPLKTRSMKCYRTQNGANTVLWVHISYRKGSQADSIQLQPGILENPFSFVTFLNLLTSSHLSPDA